MTILPAQSYVNTYEDKAVLVTGGAGFIGSHLVEALAAQGARVSVLDNLQAGTWSNLDHVTASIHKIAGDVRDSATVENILRQERPEIVFHLAANASVPNSVNDPVYDFKTNTDGTFVVLNGLRCLNPNTRFVLASSAAVYGEPAVQPIVEATPLVPISPYGASKVSAEVEADMFFKVYGVPTVKARIFNTYGPRVPRFVILDFCRKLRTNPDMLEIQGNGQQVRDFTYVDDTVAGLLVLGVRGLPGEAYNLASGTSHSVTGLARLLLELLGLAGKTRINYTGSSWVGDAQHWEVDISKARGIGYDPAFDLRRGLQLFTAWFQKSL